MVQSFPKRPRLSSGQRRERTRISVVRFKPHNSRSSSIDQDESRSCSVLDNEMRRALGKADNACLAIKTASEPTLRTRSIDFTQSLPEAMRLPTNSAAHKARPQSEAQSIADEPVFFKETDTRASVEVTGKAGEPQTTQGALSRKRQNTTSSSDKVKLIDDAILQSKN